jgi:hypothetical protein
VTTPEAFRRRQRFEGILVVIIGLGLLASTWYFNNRDEQRRDGIAATQECIAQQFQKLSDTLSARSDLTQRESNAVADVLVTAAAAKSGDEVTEALRRYDVERRAIAKARKENPLPNFPTGRCENDDAGTVPLREGIGGAPRLGVPDSGRLDGLGTEALAGAANAIHRAARGGPVDRERQPNPAPSPQPSNRPPSEPGAGGGGSGSGGGGLESVRGLADPVVEAAKETVAEVVVVANPTDLVPANCVEDVVDKVVDTLQQ